MIAMDNKKIHIFYKYGQQENLGSAMLRATSDDMECGI
jgi:hypothetical protein